MTADQILVRIQSLYRQLQRLPASERPLNGCVAQQSPRYRALEAAIRAWSHEYVRLTTRPARVDHSQYDDPKATASAA